MLVHCARRSSKIALLHVHYNDNEVELIQVKRTGSAPGINSERPSGQLQPPPKEKEEGRQTSLNNQVQGLVTDAHVGLDLAIQIFLSVHACGMCLRAQQAVFHVRVTVFFRFLDPRCAPRKCC